MLVSRSAGGRARRQPLRSAQHLYGQAGKRQAMEMVDHVSVARAGSSEGAARAT